MKKLLFAQYINYDNEKNRTTLIILNLLHELRVMTLSQMTEMINLDFKMDKTAIAHQLSDLAKAGFVEKIRFGKEMCYYLTKLGHLSIGGVYSFPKMPEYNLNHYLQINNYLIKSLRILGKHRHLKKVVSERRQVFERKDFTSNSKGRKYFVADYQVIFNAGRLAKEIVWNFEIELTWLKDHPQAYELGENESHICFEVEDYQKAYQLHKDMGCICFENKAMGLYFIHDPDDYWIEILPKK